jgi:NAD(P)-dependent dehydrogenase (short-subunit alcohol dehydrogenase family)
VKRSVAFLPFDLADASGLPELVAAVENTVGPLDILVNNAGIWRETPALAMDPVDWSQVIAINLTAPVLLATLAARGMADRGYGRIVNVTSDPWALRGRISARLRRGQGRVGASHTQPCRRSRLPRYPRQRGGAGVYLDPPQRY